MSLVLSVDVIKKRGEMFKELEAAAEEREGGGSDFRIGKS